MAEITGLSGICYLSALVVLGSQWGGCYQWEEDTPQVPRISQLLEDHKSTFNFHRDITLVILKELVMDHLLNI